MQSSQTSAKATLAATGVSRELRRWQVSVTPEEVRRLLRSRGDAGESPRRARYNLDDAASFFLSARGRERLERLRRQQKAARQTVVRHCRVQWVEWIRSAPYARIAFDATVTIEGGTATIHLADGRCFKKRLTAQGFAYTRDFDPAEARRWRAQQAARATTLTMASVKIASEQGVAGTNLIASENERNFEAERRRKFRRDLIDRLAADGAYMHYPFLPGRAQMGSEEERQFIAWVLERDAQAALCGSLSAVYQILKYRWWLRHQRKQAQQRDAAPD